MGILARLGCSAVWFSGCPHVGLQDTLCEIIECIIHIYFICIFHLSVYVSLFLYGSGPIYLPYIYIYICKRPIYKSTVNISRRQREGPLCSVYALSPAGPCVDLNTYIFIYIYIYIYIYIAHALSLGGLFSCNRN